MSLAAAAMMLVGAAVATDHRKLAAADGVGVERRSVFSRPTGLTVLFDDGLDGVLAVDLDRSVAARGVVRGQRAGDQQPRLWRERDSLVVGWGEIWAVPLDGDRSRRLGTATTAVPAVERGTVWLLDYPGGRIGTGMPAVRRVELDGQVVVEATGPDPAEYFPALGVRDGLALESRTGVAIWDPRTQQVRRRLGSGVSWVSDARADLLAWCEDACKTMHVTDVDGDDEVLLPPDDVTTFGQRSARFSPDGSLLALPVSGAGLAIAHLETGAVQVVDDVTLPTAASLAWSPDGRHLFFASYSYGENRTELGWYDTKKDTTETASLPFGGALSFVAVDRSDAEAFFPDEPGPEADCPPPTEYPSGRTTTCGFAFDAAMGDGAAVMPITFPDGRRIELRYPRKLQLANLTFNTGAAISWPVRPEPLRCCGRAVMVSRATVDDVYRGAKPIATYPGIDGRPVPYFRGSDGGRAVPLNYLVFQFGAWLVEVYDVQQPGDFEDRMTDEERATWAANLDGHVDEHGFLVLEAKPPLTVEKSGNATLSEPASGGPYVLIEEGACGQEESDTATPRAVPGPAGTGAAWCDPATGLHLYVAGPREFVDGLATGLEIHPRTPGFETSGG